MQARFGALSSRFDEGRINLYFDDVDDFRTGFELAKAAQDYEGGCAVIEEGDWDMAQIVTARYLPLCIDSGYWQGIDYDKKWAPLNDVAEITCTACGRIDETKPKAPYKIFGPCLKKHQEVYGGLCGRLVVASRVLKLMQAVVDDQIASGPAVITGRPKEDIDTGFWWIRPKYETGRQIGINGSRPCQACGMPLESRVTGESDFPAFGGREIVDSYGRRDVDIAVTVTWTGQRDESTYGNHDINRQVMVGGGLFAYLYNCDVKGLLLPSGGVYSAKMEAPWEGERRFAGLPEGRPDKVMSKQTQRRKRHNSRMRDDNAHQQANAND
jgi:hypothetical protein